MMKSKEKEESKFVNLYNVGIFDVVLSLYENY